MRRLRRRVCWLCSARSCSVAAATRSAFASCRVPRAPPRARRGGSPGSARPRGAPPPPRRRAQPAAQRGPTRAARRARRRRRRRTSPTWRPLRARRRWAWWWRRRRPPAPTATATSRTAAASSLRDPAGTPAATATGAATRWRTGVAYAGGAAAVPPTGCGVEHRRRAAERRVAGSISAGSVRAAGRRPQDRLALLEQLRERRARALLPHHPVLLVGVELRRRARRALGDGPRSRNAPTTASNSSPTRCRKRSSRSSSPGGDSMAAAQFFLLVVGDRVRCGLGDGSSHARRRRAHGRGRARRALTRAPRRPRELAQRGRSPRRGARMALPSVLIAAAMGGLLYSAGRTPLVPPGSSAAALRAWSSRASCRATASRRALRFRSCRASCRAR